VSTAQKDYFRTLRKDNDSLEKFFLFSAVIKSLGATGQLFLIILSFLSPAP
jgi:hypothetical protein